MLFMPDHDLQAETFASGLLNPETAKPAQVIGANGKAANKRYNVYRNNVTVSLTEAMADIFPAIVKLTGEVFFEAVAREYVRAHPPSSPLLFEYGHDFAAFLSDFPPVASLPYLPDVARLERAWLTAYHAADDPPLDPAKLAVVPADQVGDVRFVMHPAFAVIDSQFPLHSIFMMNRDFTPLAPVDMAAGEPALVTRPGADIHVTKLTAADAVFFVQIAGGATLSEAAVAAMGRSEAFDLNSALTTLLQTGACSGLREQDTERGNDNG